MAKATIIVTTSKEGVDEFMIRYADVRKGFVCWPPDPKSFLKKLTNVAIFTCERDARSFARRLGLDVSKRIQDPKKTNCAKRSGR
jgi:hypothetical protein